MNNTTQNLLSDIIATGLSVLFIEYAYINIKISGGINWTMIVFDSITGLASYWIVLILLKEKPKFVGMPMIIYSIILGSCFWILFHIAYVIYFDWRYLSDIRPETFVERNIAGSVSTFLYFLPTNSLITLFFVGLLRGVKKSAIWLLKKVFSSNLR